MDQRKQFIDAYMAKEESISTLCRRFGISCKTGYKWIARFSTAASSAIGRLPWNARTVFVSTVLRHQLLGLEWSERGYWAVYFGTQRIGHLTRTKTRLCFVRGQHCSRTQYQPTPVTYVSRTSA